MPTTIIGDGTDESFVGTGADEIFHTGGGNDVVDAYGGDDTLFGEGGNDSLAGGPGNDSLDGGDGDDWLLGGSINVTGADTSNGGAGNDTITAAGAPGVMYGGDGIDELQWLSISADPVLLGITSDSQPGHFEGFYRFMGVGPGIVITDGIERIIAHTGAGNDTLSGGALDDELQAYHGTNELYGFGGNDTLSYSTGGANTVDGGDGDDMAIIRTGALGDIIFTVAPDGSASDNHGSVITDVERFNLAFYSGNDWARLGAGADTAYASHGNDTILAGAGNDVVHDGYGNDSIDGEAGDDSLYGARDNDTMSGGSGEDTVKGGAGDDILSGGADADWLDGGAGADELAGDDGNDTLLGGAGDDILIGGLGADLLNGGLGADIFRFLIPADSGTPAMGRDVIRGFGAGDRIDLSAIDANGALAGDPLFDFIGTAAFSAPGQVRLNEINGNTVVQVNISGRGVAEMTIKLEGSHSLTEIDFML